MPLVPKIIFVMEDGPQAGNPIAPGGQPPGTWGGGGVPMPTPPMAPGGQPPHVWGGGGQGGVDPGYGQGQPLPPHAWGGGGNLGGGRPDNSLPPLPPPHVGLPVFPTQLPSEGGEESAGEVTTLPALPQGSFVLVWAPGRGWGAIPVGPQPEPK